MATELPKIATYEELRDIAEQAFELLEMLAGDDEEDDDESPLEDGAEEKAHVARRAAIEALRFCAAAAGQLGDVRLAPLVCRALIEVGTWDDHMSSDVDTLADGLSLLLRAGAVVDDEIEELAEHQEGHVRAAIAKGLQPHGERALALLEQLAVDTDAGVRKPARASLAQAREVPWWLGKFESDPLARLLPEEAERHKEALEELSKMLDQTHFTLMQQDEKLAALLGSLPDVLAVEAARLALSGTDRYDARLPRTGAMMIARTGGADAMIRICETWGSGPHFSLHADHVSVVADAPPEPRLRACLALARRAAEQSEEARRKQGGPAAIMAELAGKAFPPGGDLNPWIDLAMATPEAPNHELDWVIAGLRHAFDDPAADPLPVADRLLEARLAGFPGPWRRLHTGVDGMVRRLPREMLRPAAERAVRSEDDNTVGWGMEMLVLEVHDPSRDPEPLELVRRFFADERCRKPLLQLYPNGRVATVPLREALRRGELTFEQALRLTTLAAELWGGMTAPIHALLSKPEAELSAERCKLRERYAAFLGPEDMHGPLSAAEWDAFRTVRDNHPMDTRADWGNALGAFPDGPWHPEDRAFFDAAFALCEDDGEDLAYWLAMALLVRPSVEDLPLFERLLKQAPDQRSSLRRCLLASRAALGLPVRTKGSEAAGGEDVEREWMDEDEDEDEDDEEEDEDDEG